jgi:mono/diheme cytochrome c family protein
MYTGQLAHPAIEFPNGDILRLICIAIVAGIAGGGPTLAAPVRAQDAVQAIAFADQASAPTYNKEVAPILFKNCAKCHTPGEIGSGVSLLSYDAARPWAKAIKEKVLLHEMPPWPADPNASVKFRNDARLSQQNINTLVAWVNAGAPQGNDRDLPPSPQQAQGWLHPQGLPPDAVISLPGEFQVPAKGEIPYIRFLAKVPFSEDKWVVATQVHPGNGAVVHHMAITELELADGVKPADLNAFAALARQLGISNANPARPAVATPSNPAVYDMLGVYTPGTTFEMYGNNSAKLLKGGKNLYLNFNIHYTTTGKAERDRSTMALWFQPAPPKHQLFRVAGAIDTIIASGKELLTDAPGDKAEGTHVAIPPIPPNAENYEVIGITAYTEPVTIYQFQPHAHLRAKDFKYTVVYPDGREQTVLSVPKYDFNWQLAYELETPLKLPAGSKLVVTAHYDNSPRNKSNPGPEKDVYFRGENQSFDEMFTPFIQYTIDSQDLTNPRATAQLRHDPNGPRIAEVDGCLVPGPTRTWMLVGASDPIMSATQATTSVALQTAGANPAGHGRYQLLGAGIFNPSTRKGQKVAAKGALIKNASEDRLNVTSLELVGGSCS